MNDQALMVSFAHGSYNLLVILKLQMSLVPNTDIEALYTDKRESQSTRRSS